MGQFLYERPREKMQRQGVAVLKNAELLQVIIGSGNAHTTVVKIARKVEKILKRSGLDVTMAELTTIQGLGLIKAGQILAGIELVTRMTYQVDAEATEKFDILDDLYIDVRNSKKLILVFAFFDGNSRLIDDSSFTLKRGADSARIIRNLFAEALAHSTASLTIIVGYADQQLEPGMFELSLARDAYKMAALLSLPIKSFMLINAKGEYALKETNL